MTGPLQSPAVTLGELLRAATERLAAAGIASPRVDAELLACHALHTDRAGLMRRSGSAVGPDESAALDAMLARREAREPLQHIVGSAPFRHLVLAVGPGVFVPRPETELLVDAVLPHLRSLPEPTVIDVCSGSGALALAVQYEVPTAHVVALESDAAALEWLSRNAAATHQLMGPGARQVEIRRFDVAESPPPTETAWADAVVSNPPYVPTGTPVESEVRADPPQAVFAGPDGLALIPHVIDLAARWLRPGGVFAMEHDETHAEAVGALLGGDTRWRDVQARQDLTGRPRFQVAVRG